MIAVVIVIGFAALLAVAVAIYALSRARAVEERRVAPADSGLLTLSRGILGAYTGGVL